VLTILSGSWHANSYPHSERTAPRGLGGRLRYTRSGNGSAYDRQPGFRRGWQLCRRHGADAAVRTGAAADHNHDGYGCMWRGTSIAGDSLLFEGDNDASSAGGAPQREPVWDGLYTRM
jgi:hypothetical protein